MPIATTIRSVRRAHQILAVLVKYGFRELVDEARLGSILGRGAAARISGIVDSEVAGLSEPQRVRHALEELGPTFAKVGQVLATRPDLIPEEWAEEFRHLQAGIPPAPWEAIEPILRARFRFADEAIIGGDPHPDAVDDVDAGGRDGKDGKGEKGAASGAAADPGGPLDVDRDARPMLRSVEREPLAAASMAQVHRATLADGTDVVLKVLRPGIRDVVAGDMEILRALASLLEDRFRNAGYSATAVVDQFARELERETDLELEAHSTQRMRADFADDERVRFPKVYAEGSDADVLVLEEIHGRLLSRTDVRTLTDAERDHIVTVGTDVVFKQCLVVGFFHADPHPGNIFLTDDGALAFIDCGMTGHADPQTVELLADLVYGSVKGDLERVIRAALSLAEAEPTLADDRRFRTDVWRFIDHFRGDSLDDLHMGRLLDDFFTLLRRYHLRCPADIVHLIKAITTIEGVAEAIAPEADVIAQVRPYVERLVKRRVGIRAIRNRFQNSAVEWAELAERSPRQLRELLDAARHGRLSVTIEHGGLREFERTITAAALTISAGLMIAALVVGGAVLLLADSVDRDLGLVTWLGGAAFLAAGGLAVVQVVASMRRRHLLRRERTGSR